MSLIESTGDHPKEYFYKISKDGKKLFYHRTAEGHKKIAKSKINPEFIDKIKQFDDKEDQNLMKGVKDYNKKIKELEDKLKRLDILNLTPANMEISRNILQNRLRDLNSYVDHLKIENKRQSEKRYKEEMKYHNGFKNYFKDKWGHYIPKTSYSSKTEKINLLIQVGIIENGDEPKEKAKKKYKRWLVHNHPDKGGDTEICARVIDAFNSIYSQ